MESRPLEGDGYNGKPLSSRTVLQVHRVLSKCLNDAVKVGILVRNVAASVEPPRVTKYEAHVLGWNEVHKFLEGIPNPIYLTLVLLDIQTGLRRSELLGLQWRDVDFSAGTLSIQRALIKLPSGEMELTVPKSGRGRVVDCLWNQLNRCRLTGSAALNSRGMAISCFAILMGPHLTQVS